MRILVLTLLMLLTRFSVAADRPNILIAISDDQSYGHASAYGCTYINTPAFDRVASQGVLFTNAYGACPGCSPCRAALLTGRHIWQIEHAGTHDSSFPAKYRTYPEVLGENGYWVGYTGKGWGPGNYKVDGRTENPTGPAFSSKKTKAPHSGISKTDYAANFADFLEQKPEDKPFCFWYGGHEPHRGFEKGSGLKAGKKLEDAQVPGFLPDSPEIRSDLLDYAVEIEWFDLHLGRIIEQLETAGELDNTLIIVTSDNGMSFPRAKANCYDAGIHMPLAIRWRGIDSPGRTCEELIGFVDLTDTIYEVTGTPHPSKEFPLSGHSLLDILQSSAPRQLEIYRNAVYSGRERHSSSRYQNLAYPQRAIRSGDHLLIKNFRPERWPAGPGQLLSKNGELGPPHDGYHDIDACPSLSYLVEHHDDPEVSKFFHMAVDPRPQFELFNVKTDPDCLLNLAGTEEHSMVQARMRKSLENYLKETGDPRELNGGEIFETYRRFSSVRDFPMPEHVKKEHEKLQSEGWISLFNGRDLKGWKASMPSNSFSVVNGMIKAQATSDQSHLFYTGDVNGADFKDFELKIICMTLPGANSGVYFHTEYQETDFPNRGHEVQINNSNFHKTKTGSLFGVVNIGDTEIPDKVLFTETVKVVGKHVTIQVNGKTTVDYEEPIEYSHPRYTDRRIDHGTFALQAHDPESVVYFKEIWVRPLR